jgi:hypothetical protein
MTILNTDWKKVNFDISFMNAFYIMFKASMLKNLRCGTKLYLRLSY